MRYCWSLVCAYNNYWGFVLTISLSTVSWLMRNCLYLSTYDPPTPANPSPYDPPTLLMRPPMIHQPPLICDPPTPANLSPYDPPTPANPSPYPPVIHQPLLICPPVIHQPLLICPSFWKWIIMHVPSAHLVNPPTPLTHHKTDFPNCGGLERFNCVVCFSSQHFPDLQLRSWR
jgi:hypothetical protein